MLLGRCSIDHWLYGSVYVITLLQLVILRTLHSHVCFSIACIAIISFFFLMLQILDAFSSCYSSPNKNLQLSYATMILK
jgi:hypothetical protein